MSIVKVGGSFADRKVMLIRKVRVTKHIDGFDQVVIVGTTGTFGAGEGDPLAQFMDGEFLCLRDAPREAGNESHDSKETQKGQEVKP